MNEDVKKDIAALKLSNYKNSTAVIGGMTTEEIVKACLMARLNLFVIGETGEGKTQLENDVRALFGNKGMFELGRDDLTLRERCKASRTQAHSSNLRAHIGRLPRRRSRQPVESQRSSVWEGPL